MPNYDLKCSDCGEKFSAQVSIKEREELTCPKCGSKSLTQESKNGRARKRRSKKRCFT